MEFIFVVKHLILIWERFVFYDCNFFEVCAESLIFVTWWSVREWFVDHPVQDLPAMEFGIIIYYYYNIMQDKWM